MKPRKKHKSLPNRVYIHHGSYTYLPIEPIRVNGEMKRRVKLCRVEEGEQVMLRKLSEIMGDRTLDKSSVSYVCAEYKANKLGKYEIDTRIQYGKYLDDVSAAFAEFMFSEPTTKDCADYLRAKFSEKHNTAQKVAGLMTRMFKYGISEMGLRQDNPMDQIDVSDYETQSRGIIPTHDQVKAIREAGMHSKPRRDNGLVLPTRTGPMFQCLVDMAYLCWQRQVDVREIKESQIDGGWIRFKPRKTGKSSAKVVDIKITPQIQAVIDRAKEIKRAYNKEREKKGAPQLVSAYLFPVMQGESKGNAYTKSGLYRLWNNARDRLGIGKESPPDERIQFKDLRSLAATDAAKAKTNMEELRKRLAHTTTKTSAIYVKEAIPEQSEIDVNLPW